jgi:glycosyltransferase involved in cell wall biosynthesis
MRICIITKFIPPASTDGIPRTRWEYANQFASLGHEVHIITSGLRGNERLEGGIYIHEIPAWDEQVFSKMFTSLAIDDTARHLLCYSYLVCERIKRLHQVFPIDIIDSPLWDIEGYVTKLKLPNIPVVVRLETTSMLLREILDEKKPYKNVLNELETHFMQLADGFVFDSWSILRETGRLYKFNFNTKPYCVVHHGIKVGSHPQCLEKTTFDNAARNTKVLVAGRLEKRKGSDILVKQVLPQVLEKNSDIEFHIVGKDSAEWDGFKEKEGVTYHDFIRTNYRKYIGKKIFLYGYVNDETLNRLYSETDIILALSRYESFGLLYLEAMQKGKPLIALRTGAVPEIFEDDRDAILISPSSIDKVADAIVHLCKNPSKRYVLAKNAFEKLKSNFSSELMGKKCAGFFEELVFKTSDLRIVQMMNCLTDKDGVSNTTIDYDELFKQKGTNTQIIGTWASPTVEHLSQPIDQVHLTTNDYLIYHYWNYCEKGDYFNDLVGPHKIFFFHNITDPNYFSRDDEAYPSTSKGYEQLQMFNNFDIYVCHTAFSASILKQAINKPITTYLIPPIIDREALLKKPYDVNIIEKNKFFNLIFVGSIGPHKRQTDLVRFFHYYFKNINPNARLTIIGGGAPKYVNEVKSLIKSLQISEHVCLTGKISNEELHGYYRIADVFLSMSEHEGFGVPLAEAMAFEIPVVAYKCTAIPDTVGENECLFEKKDFHVIASIIENLKDEDFKRKVIELQDEQLKKFSPDAVWDAFRRLFNLTHLHWKEHLFEKIEMGLLADNVIRYNDDRLQKVGSTRLTDDQLLLVDCRDDDSYIAVEDIFQEAEITFLCHQWSGKVRINVDDNFQAEFDLYTLGREIRTINLDKSFGLAKHKLVIRPSGEKNSHSMGTEVFLVKINLKKPFTLDDSLEEQTIEYPIEDTGNSIPANFDTGQEQADEEYDAMSELDKKVVVVQEIASTKSSIIYHNEWIIRDNFFRFTNGKTSQNYFEFTGDFSTLDLVFIAHDWSGKVVVNVDENYQEVLNLYSSTHQEKTFRLKKVFPMKEHHVVVRAIEEKDNRSKGFEVFFKGLVLNKNIYLDITDELLKREYRVSVIVNTLNRASHLRSLLRELDKQTYPFFEVIVVNGPSTDDTCEVLKEYEDRIKIVDCPEANLSLSRNIGIENSAGEYVAFIDDDALPCHENWLRNFIYFIVSLSDKKVGTVGGPVKHKNTEHYEFKNGATSDYGFQIFRGEELQNRILDGRRWVQGIPGGNNIVLKKALYEIGGFDERFVYYLDETDVCIRLARKGYTIINNSTNYIRHFKAPGKLRKSAYDIGWDIIARSDMFYALKNGHDILPIRLLKAIMFFKKKHFYKEVIQAYRRNVISVKEYKKYRRLLRRGFFQGLKWGLFSTKQENKLTDRSKRFHNFSQAEVVV